MPAVAENVIVARFEDEGGAHRAFGALERADADGLIRLLGAAVVGRGAVGVVRIEEGAPPEVAPVGTATGGLIGLFVGVLGGRLACC